MDIIRQANIMFNCVRLNPVEEMLCCEYKFSNCIRNTCTRLFQIELICQENQITTLTLLYFHIYFLSTKNNTCTTDRPNGLNLAESQLWCYYRSICSNLFYSAVCKKVTRLIPFSSVSFLCAVCICPLWALPPSLLPQTLSRRLTGNSQLPVAANMPGC